MTTEEYFKIQKEVRLDILKMSFAAQSAHAGGAYSCVEILVALYWNILHIFPKNSQHPNRDRLIFSKGHDAKALFAVLARRGFFNPKILLGYEKDGGKLHGHSTRGMPGVETSNGSLGHGLPMSVGMAYALKKLLVGPSSKVKKTRVFTIISDGECDEGTTWESALYAVHHKLDNLTVIIDYNKLQGYGTVNEILALEPLARKWESFGWVVHEVNGHDIHSLIALLKKLPFKKNTPSLVIAHTIKGLGGVEHYVNQVASQYKPPTKEEFKKTKKTLESLSSMNELLKTYQHLLYS